MRLLILTQYYPPETGAPQNRLHELALKLVQRGVEVEVLTAMPNYPQMKIYPGYRGKWFMTETIDSIKVHRSLIYVSLKRSIVFRLLNYFSFVKSSALYGIFLRSKYDYVLCESPPLFLGMSAWFLALIKRAELIFNVSDLWPESAEKLGIVTNRTALNLAFALEMWLYRRSSFITGQTQGIVSNIRARVHSAKLHWLPNGVDIEMYDPNKFDRSWRVENGFQEDHVLLLYAGIIGHAQGLEIVLKAAPLLEKTPVQFILLGEGPVKEELMEQAKALKLENVHFFDGVSKPAMGPIISAADIAFVPLKKLDIFTGAIPSKIFENLAMEKPLLLGVDGEAKTLFIDQANAGWHYQPEDSNDLVRATHEILSQSTAIATKGANGRKFVAHNFNRELIADRFVKFLKTEN